MFEISNFLLFAKGTFVQIDADSVDGQPTTQIEYCIRNPIELKNLIGIP